MSILLSIQWGKFLPRELCFLRHIYSQSIITEITKEKKSTLFNCTLRGEKNRSILWLVVYLVWGQCWRAFKGLKGPMFFESIPCKNTAVLLSIEVWIFCEFWRLKNQVPCKRAGEPKIVTYMSFFFSEASFKGIVICIAWLFDNRNHFCVFKLQIRLAVS